MKKTLFITAITLVITGQLYSMQRENPNDFTEYSKKRAVLCEKILQDEDALQNIPMGKIEKFLDDLDTLDKKFEPARKAEKKRIFRNWAVVGAVVGASTGLAVAAGSKKTRKLATALACAVAGGIVAYAPASVHADLKGCNKI